MDTSRRMRSAAVALMLSGAWPARAGTPVAEAQFRRGKQLIEMNAADSVNASRAALEDGVASLEKALRLGCADRRTALKLVALGYNSLAFYHSADGSSYQKRYMAKEEEAKKQLGAVAGDDLESLLSYSGTVQDPAEQLRVLSKAAKLSPNDQEIERRLGYVMVSLGKPDAAMEHFRRFVELAPEQALWTTEIPEVLEKMGKLKESEEIGALAFASPHQPAPGPGPARVGA
jgi:tetratricopeptide (TPR) repeat protein